MSTMILTMPGSTIEAWFTAARRRWPSIAWPLVRFQRHVGDDSPRHPEDLYLGGAAAEREPAAWSAIQADAQNDVSRKLSVIARGGLDVDDLWSETIARLMSEDAGGEPLPSGQLPARIRQFRGDSTMMTYLLVVARNIARDLHRRARVITEDAMDLVEDGHVRVKDPDDRTAPHGASASEEARQLAQLFARAFLSLPPLQQALLQLVFGQEMPKGRAGQLLGMEAYEVSRTLKNAVDRLRIQLQPERDGPWTGEVITVWLKGWSGSKGRKDGTETQGDGS